MAVYTSMKICRSCLSTEGGLLPLDSVVDSSFRIVDCLRDQLHIVVSEDDGLPYEVCLKCLDTLLQIRRFHIRYLKSERILLKQCTPLKQESNFEIASEDEKQPTVGEREETLDLGTEASKFFQDVSNASGDLSDSGNNSGGLEDADPLGFNVETIDDFEQLIDEKEKECEQDFGVDCQIANKLKDGRLYLSEHNKNRNNPSANRKKFSKIYCLQCHEQFATKNDLRAHFHSKHGEENARGFCKHCSQTFPKRGQLMIHLQTHKFSESPRYICSFCGRKFKRSSDTIVHERTHTGEKPYTCSICNRRFCQRSVLLTHMTLHTGKSIQCELCDKKFSRRSFLKIHMSSHSGTRPYECHLCEKKYRMKHHLNSHISTHSEERNFSCEVCGHAFKSKKNLSRHMSVHTMPSICTGRNAE